MSAAMGPDDLDRTDWPDAMATVTECRYEMRAGRALAFGLPASRHFHIRYNYWAGDALHVGECYAAKAMPVGTLFPIHYDPNLPQRSRNPAGLDPAAASRIPLFAFGIAGSIVLSLLWLLVLRGCSPVR